MRYLGLVDLDELVLSCRDLQARDHIQEAVACYKAGAFRAAIVSTWNALVFDFIHKLSELRLTSDPNASQLLEHLEKVRAGGESRMADAQKFEREILDKAETVFELITPIEKMDLSRLQADRNRCAHPSMQSGEEPYNPTPELARAHIRNAVEILLQREPVQGKSALERLKNEVLSNYFPTTINDAKAHFSTGPLKRARQALIRDFLIATTKHALDQQLTEHQRLQHSAAVGAVFEMHREVSETVLRTKLLPILQGASDAQLPHILAFLKGFPQLWTFLDNPFQAKLKRFAESAIESSDFATIGKLLSVPGLQNIAIENFNQFDEEGQVKIITSVGPHSYLIPRAIQLFLGSGGWRTAENRAETLLIPMATLMTAEQINSALAGIQVNRQIWDASAMPVHLQRLFDLTKHQLGSTSEQWKLLGGFLKEKDQSAYARFIKNLADSGIAVG